MPRPRVLSFMSQWAPGQQKSNGTEPTKSSLAGLGGLASSSVVNLAQSIRSTSGGRSRSDTAPSRPLSSMQSYQPPTMNATEGNLPELQPIFSYLNSHSTKLYQEGYFLKLYDLDARGRPSPDRSWTECFAQLVGTVLSLWDAAALDAAGSEGEVEPTFINLADASIKMIESLPMNGQEGQNLQNVLSISTAANNRYLLHFNSLNALTQWTAGIRLAMFENSTLQEAYTGSLIAGKGKRLNNMKIIMDRARSKHEDWARVRFGAGTPWRRCWCVVSPPDEKEVIKLEKQKKKGIYDRNAPLLKGDIKFYDTKKITKRTVPIATIKDAYSAYAIYPQSKPLIDQSTLVKIEGVITIHGNQESTTEGFVFVMPEVHPAVSGFEMMIRFLFPVFDTFCLYGRPGKLIADVIDPRGLMFAMPTNRRYGYLDILDVAALIHTDGSGRWSERQWRKQLKDLTAKRMQNAPNRQQSRSRRSTSQSRGGSRISLPPKPAIKFQGDIRSQPNSRKPSPPLLDTNVVPQENALSAPVSVAQSPRGHQRSVSEAFGYQQYNSPPAYELEDNSASPPAPPVHQQAVHGFDQGHMDDYFNQPGHLGATAAVSTPLAPVPQTPTFTHPPGARPPTSPYVGPPIGRVPSIVDDDTLKEMREANPTPGFETPGSEWRDEQNGDATRQVGEEQRGVYANANMYQPYRATDDSFKVVDNRSGASSTQLPTIPASPFLSRNMTHDPPSNLSTPRPNQRDSSPASRHSQQSQNSYYMTPPAESASNPLYLQNAPAHERRPSSNSTHSMSIKRKPVASRSSYSSQHQTSQSQAENYAYAASTDDSDVGSLRDHMIDADALDRITQQERANSMASSNYDNASLPSTDYASTKGSSPRPSVERPRYGVLRTVGTVQPSTNTAPSARSSHHGPPTGVDIPTIDFGPTYALNPSENKRPDTSGTITQEDPSSSHLGVDSSTPTHRRSQSASPNATDRTSTHENRRSMAWTPGMMPADQPRTRHSVTPEEWVQQRAAAASQPYMPVRTSPTPGQEARAKSATPPLNSRNSSADWSQLRPTSKTPEPGRPHSRGASVYLQPSPSQGLINSDQARRLSAREQEYVARVTGTPLLQDARKPKENKDAEGPGLIGAIATREKERKDMKEGRSGAMVAAAIAATAAQRQQQMMHEQQKAMQEQQRRYTQQQQQAAFMAAYNSGMGGGHYQQASPYGSQMNMAPQQQYQQAYGQQQYPQAQQQYGQYQQYPSGYQQPQGQHPGHQQNNMYQQPPQAYGSSYYQAHNRQR